MVLGVKFISVADRKVKDLSFKRRVKMCGGTQPEGGID